MQFTVLITVFVISPSSEHKCFVASDSRCILERVHITSGAGRLTEACSHLFPAITRAPSAHTPTQSDYFMFSFIFHEFMGNFEQFYFAVAIHLRFGEKLVFVNLCILNIPQGGTC
jgi:hypothetical protein